MNYKYSLLAEAAAEKTCSFFQQYILLYLEVFTNLNQLSRCNANYGNPTEEKYCIWLKSSLFSTL